MNGEIFFGGFGLCLRCSDPFEDETREYESLSEIVTIEDLIQKEKSSKSEAYKVSTALLNDFLKRRFEHDLPDFMKLYSKAHFSGLGFEFEGEGIVLPVASTTACYLGETNNPEHLAAYLADYQASVVRGPFGETRLNLHNDTIYKFTIIRANFSLEAEKNKFYFGYHFTTDKFRFFIKSSVQFDLTVVYEEL